MIYLKILFIYSNEQINLYFYLNRQKNGEKFFLMFEIFAVVVV